MGIITLVGIGIWYFCFYDSAPGATGTGESTSNSSASSSNQPINIIENQTNNNNINWLRRPLGNTAHFNKYNVLDQLDQVREHRIDNILNNSNLNTPSSPSSSRPSNSGGSDPFNYERSASPTGSDGSDETIRQTDWQSNWDVKEAQNKLFKNNNKNNNNNN